MQEKNNSFCAICNEPYYLCLSCKDKIKLKPYKVHTDTAEHYKIFEVLRGYNLGLLSKEKAKAMLEKVNLSDVETFKENIKEKIDEIMKVEVVENDIVEKTIKKTNKKFKNKVVSENDIEEKFE